MSYSKVEQYSQVPSFWKSVRLLCLNCLSKRQSVLKNVSSGRQSLYLKRWILTILCMNLFPFHSIFQDIKELKSVLCFYFKQIRSVYTIWNWRKVSHRFVHQQNSWHFFLSQISRKHFFMLWIWGKGMQFFNHWWMSFFDNLFPVRDNFNDIPSP